MKRVLIVSCGIGACATGTTQRSQTPDPCAADTAIYSYPDTLHGVSLPIPGRMLLPRGGFGKVTAQGTVGKNGRIERGSLRTFGSPAMEEREAAADALFWTSFSPARRDGCAVRFRYRITFLVGIPQAVPEDTAAVRR